MQYNWTPYAIGGATRPDSFSSMTPAMQQGLWAMLQASDAEIGPGLQVYSGYRSPELQAQLYQNALKKYGSESAARKWVAPPGRSRHNSGQAADLKYNGIRIDKLPEDHKVRQWLSGNVGRFGLAQPMSWEPWQVEVAGARGGQVGPTQALANSGQPLATRTPPIAQEGFDMQGLFDGLAEIAQESPVFSETMGAPPPMALAPAPPVQPIQAERRDTITPYLELFRSLGVS